MRVRDDSAVAPMAPLQVACSQIRCSVVVDVEYGGSVQASLEAVMTPIDFADLEARRTFKNTHAR
jgi:hypothetical protein